MITRIKGIYNKHTYHKYIVNIFIECMFILFTLIMSWFYITHDYIVNGQQVEDAEYHLQGIMELKNDFSHFENPAFNHYFGVKGLALPTYYPILSFLPSVLCKLIGLPTSIAFKASCMLFIFLFLNIAFFTSRNYWHNNKEALLFTIILSMMSCQYTNFQQSGDFSISLGLSFIILVIFGWIHWAQSNRWKMLSCGMILLLATSFELTFIIALGLTLPTIFILFKRISSKKICSGLKAIFCTAITSAYILVPLVVLSLTNKIYRPVSQKLFIFFNKQLSTNIMYFLIKGSIIDSLLLLIIFCHFKALAPLAKSLVIVASVLIIIELGIIPIHIIIHTPIIYAQFYHRLLPISHPFIVISATPIIYKMLFKSNIEAMLVAIMIGFGIFMPFEQISKMNPTIEPIKKFTNGPNIKVSGTNKASHNFNISCKHQKNENSHIYFGRNNNKFLESTYYYNEFMPQQAINLYNNDTNGYIYYGINYPPNTASILMAHNIKQEHMVNIYNGIRIKNNNHIANKRIPIITYNDQKYQFYDNGNKAHPIAYQGHEPIFKIKRGTHNITFKTPYEWYRTVADGVSIISLGVFLMKDIKKRKD